MVEIEPNLPEPTAEPTALFAGTANGLLVRRRLFCSRVEICDAKQTNVRVEDVINSIQ